MDLKKLVLSTITVAAFSLCFLAPAFAAEPHLSQKEALAKFNAMHLPDMPVEMAKETRGGYFTYDMFAPLYQFYSLRFYSGNASIFYNANSVGFGSNVSISQSEVRAQSPGTISIGSCTINGNPC